MRRRRSEREFQLVSVFVTAREDPFTLTVEPEGMSYDFPHEEKLLLTFRGNGAARFELSYGHGSVQVWRPADTEVWAATSRNQQPQQIGGWTDNPAPGLDTAAPRVEMPFPEWDHLPLPHRGS